MTKKGVRPFSCALRMYERGRKKSPCMHAQSAWLSPEGVPCKGFFFTPWSCALHKGGKIHAQSAWLSPEGGPWLYPFALMPFFFSPSFFFFIPHPAIVTAGWKDGSFFWKHIQIYLFEGVFLCNLFSLFCINKRFIKKMIIHFFKCIIFYKGDSSRNSLVVLGPLMERVC